MMRTKSLLFDALTESALTLFKRPLNPSAVAPELIPLFCRWFDCQWGTYWRIDQRKLLLTSIYTWNNHFDDSEGLRRGFTTWPWGPTGKTAEQVWRLGTPICTDDIQRDMCQPQSMDAGDGGSCGGICFPIGTERATYAVIELVGRHNWSCEERFISELKGFGNALGSAFASD
jgi:hypothetical protein